jgi:class 3 adenylate cyclase
LKRKIAAILSADVEGYSRLMGLDEESTIRTLNNYRSAMTALIQQYRGRVMDAPCDNVLAEFASVVDSVNCAVEIQRELAEKNVELPEDCKMLFRIGVNLGDVVEEDGRIYGDGVNITARLENLAEAGGICISGTAYDHIKPLPRPCSGDIIKFTTFVMDFRAGRPRVILLPGHEFSSVYTIDFSLKGTFKIRREGGKNENNHFDTVCHFTFSRLCVYRPTSGYVSGGGRQCP